MDLGVLWLGLGLFSVSGLGDLSLTLARTLLDGHGPNLNSCERHTSLGGRSSASGCKVG